MLEVPRGDDLGGEADHVRLEGDVDEDRVLLVVDGLEQLGHDGPDRLAGALERGGDLVRVGRIRDPERVGNSRSDLGDLKV